MDLGSMIGHLYLRLMCVQEEFIIAMFFNPVKLYYIHVYLIHACICQNAYMLRRKYRWINIYKYYLNVMVALFWGGGGERMHGRVRGIALLCVQKMNHHTFGGKKIAMQLNRVANQLRSCVAKLLRNF